MLPSDYEYVEGLKLRGQELQSEISGAEIAIERILESGEFYAGEINKHLTALEILRTQSEFAEYAVSILETSQLPERITTPHQKKPGGITDLEIEQARNYPIDRLIETKRNRAHCINPDHDDKNPSMDVRKNFCYCYACGFSGDAIKVYMTVHGCDFIAAVRALNT